MLHSRHRHRFSLSFSREESPSRMSLEDDWRGAFASPFVGGLSSQRDLGSKEEERGGDKEILNGDKYSMEWSCCPDKLESCSEEKDKEDEKESTHAEVLSQSSFDLPPASRRRAARTLSLGSKIPAASSPTLVATTTTTPPESKDQKVVPYSLSPTPVPSSPSVSARNSPTVFPSSKELPHEARDAGSFFATSSLLPSISLPPRAKEEENEPPDPKDLFACSQALDSSPPLPSAPFSPGSSPGSLSAGKDAQLVSAVVPAPRRTGEEGLMGEPRTRSEQAEKREEEEETRREEEKGRPYQQFMEIVEDRLLKERAGETGETTPEKDEDERRENKLTNSTGTDAPDLDRGEVQRGQEEQESMGVPSLHEVPSPPGCKHSLASQSSSSSASGSPSSPPLRPCPLLRLRSAASLIAGASFKKKFMARLKAGGGRLSGSLHKTHHLCQGRLIREEAPQLKASVKADHGLLLPLPDREDNARSGEKKRRERDSGTEERLKQDEYLSDERESTPPCTPSRRQEGQERTALPFSPCCCSVCEKERKEKTNSPAGGQSHEEPQHQPDDQSGRRGRCSLSRSSSSSPRPGLLSHHSPPEEEEPESLDKALGEGERAAEGVESSTSRLNVSPIFSPRRDVSLACSEDAHQAAGDANGRGEEVACSTHVPASENKVKMTEVDNSPPERGGMRGVRHLSELRLSVRLKFFCSACPSEHYDEMFVPTPAGGRAGKQREVFLVFGRSISTTLIALFCA